MRQCGIAGARDIAVQARGWPRRGRHAGRGPSAGRPGRSPGRWSPSPRRTPARRTAPVCRATGTDCRDADRHGRGGRSHSRERSLQPRRDVLERGEQVSLPVLYGFCRQAGIEGGAGIAECHVPHRGCCAASSRPSPAAREGASRSRAARPHSEGGLGRGSNPDGTPPPHRPARRAMPASARPQPRSHRGNRSPAPAPCAAPSRQPATRYRRCRPGPARHPGRAPAAPRRDTARRRRTFSSSSRRMKRCRASTVVKSRNARRTAFFSFHTVSLPTNTSEICVSTGAARPASAETPPPRPVRAARHRRVRGTACRRPSRRRPRLHRQCGRAAGTACSARTRIASGSTR